MLRACGHKTIRSQFDPLLDRVPFVWAPMALRPIYYQHNLVEALHHRMVENAYAKILSRLKLR